MTTATPWAHAFNEVGWALPAILTVENKDRAVACLERYFETSEAGVPGFTGSLFEQFGGGGDQKKVKNQITADDLLSLSLLDVPIRGPQVVQFLAPQQSTEPVDLTQVVTRNHTAYQLPYDLAQINGILASIPVDVGLGSKKAVDHIEFGNQLWVALRRKGFGPARVSKLIARKRPKLFPIIDSLVEKQLDTDSLGFYENLHTVLRAENKALAQHLKSIRAEAAKNSDNENLAHLSTIRVFDIVVWMTADTQA